MHTDCFPITVLPHLSRLFTDYAESRTPLPYYPLSPYSQEWASQPSSLDPTVRAAVSDLEKVQGINAATARAIYDFFHANG